MAATKRRQVDARIGIAGSRRSLRRRASPKRFSSQCLNATVDQENASSGPAFGRSYRGDLLREEVTTNSAAGIRMIARRPLWKTERCHRSCRLGCALHVQVKLNLVQVLEHPGVRRVESPEYGSSVRVQGGYAMLTASQRTKPLGLFPRQAMPRLYDQLVGVLRVRHYSRRTEEAYVHWIRRYIALHQHRHPRRLAEGDVNPLFTHLAVKEHVAASTQNQGVARERATTPVLESTSHTPVA